MSPNDFWFPMLKNILWFSPSTIMVKILLQRLWEVKIGWDDTVPSSIYDVWFQWISEPKMLATKHIPRCHFPQHFQVTTLQLHGFSDASEHAYAGVIYLHVKNACWRKCCNLTSNFQNQSGTPQTLDYPMTGVVRCPPTNHTSSPCEGSLSSLIQ